MLVSGEEYSDLNRGYTPQYDNFDRRPSPLNDARDLAMGHLQHAAINNPELVEHFHSCIQLLQDHNKDVVLIRYPFSYEYHQAIYEYLPTDGIDPILADIRSRYPEIPILDFQDVYHSQRDHFSDPHHLNTNGAEQFSLNLAHWLGNRPIAVQ